MGTVKLKNLNKPNLELIFVPHIDCEQNGQLLYLCLQEFSSSCGSSPLLLNCLHRNIFYKGTKIFDLPQLNLKASLIGQDCLLNLKSPFPPFSLMPLFIFTMIICDEFSMKIRNCIILVSLLL